MGKPNKARKRRQTIKASKWVGDCPLCKKPVHDHDTHLDVTLHTHDGDVIGRVHAGCAGAYEAYRKLTGRAS